LGSAAVGLPVNAAVQKEMESLREANDLLGRLRRIIDQPVHREWGVSLDSLDEIHLDIQARFGALIFESEPQGEKQ